MTERIEQYFATVGNTTPMLWEISLARHILQSCHTLFTELERVKLGLQGTIGEMYKEEWVTTKGYVEELLQALYDTEQSTNSKMPSQGQQEQNAQYSHTSTDGQSLVHASRQTVKALYTCVSSLASDKRIEDSNEYVLRAMSMALHTVAVEIKLAHDGVRSSCCSSSAIQNTEALSKVGVSATSSSSVSTTIVPPGNSGMQGPYKAIHSRSESRFQGHKHEKSNVSDHTLMPMGSDLSLESKTKDSSTSNVVNKGTEGDTPSSVNIETIGTTEEDTAALGLTTKGSSESLERVASSGTDTGIENIDINGNVNADRKSELDLTLYSSVSIAIRTSQSISQSLVERLLVFTRESHPPRIVNMPRLVHTPSVPSPLASESTEPQHQRWVSDDVGANGSSIPGLRISIDGEPLGLGALNVSAPHSRNRSSISSGGSPSIISNRQSPGLGDQADGRRVVRIPGQADDVTAATHRRNIQELLRAVQNFERALSSIGQVIEDIEQAGINSMARHVMKAFTSAFIELSRISSSTGLIRQYDKPTLSCFKETTQAIKGLMSIMASS